MPVKIQKQIGETAYFYPKIRNADAQTAVVQILLGESGGFGNTFQMPANSENEYELSTSVLIAPGIYDVNVRVFDKDGQLLLDELSFPGEFEVIEVTPTYYTLTIGLTGMGSTNPPPGTYTYEEGSNVSVQAIPASGWEFDSWWIDNVLWSSINPYAMYMNKNRTIIARFYQPSPPGPTVAEQLASCWNYISGGGTYHGTPQSHDAIWAYRNGIWLVYSSYKPEFNTLESFMAGDWASLYLIQPCTLTYDGKSKNLVTGWNEFIW